MPNTQDIVQKLWNLCHVLRDDGITYHEYVTELTFLLFLKMMKETGAEEQIPKGYRWDDVTKKDGVELLDFYKKLLIDLGSKGSGRVQAIFANTPRATSSSCSSNTSIAGSDQAGARRSCSPTMCCSKKAWDRRCART